MKICASCKPEENIDETSMSVSLPQWLQQTNFVRNFIESMHSKSKAEKHTSHLLFEIQFHSSMKNKRLLLWATVPSTTLEIKDAKSAYHHFENHQITKISATGKARIYLETPQIYYVMENKKKVVYPRHFHFVIRDGEKWNPQVYTHIVTPTVEKDFVEKKLKTKTALVINSLPSNLFHETKIHESAVHLSVEDLQKKGKIFARRKVLSFAKLKAPKLYTLIQSKKLKLEHIPMIVYCKNKNCKSAPKWTTIMVEFGFYNIYHYGDGSDGFTNNA
jgi:hypothetical protein